jgi:flavin-dependent dehydrogenase
VSTTNAFEADFDVLVAGGGPAGCATALALSRAGWRTAVVDRTRTVRASIGESLPSAALPLLESLELHDAFAGAPHRRVRANRSCWGQALPTERSALFAAHGEGWHLDRHHFDNMLRVGAFAAGASFIDGRVRMVDTSHKSGLTVCIARGRRGDTTSTSLDVRTRSIVDATGRNATVARQLGARLRRADKLVAVCTHSVIHPPLSAHDAVSFVEACADGWWYSAPLPNGPYTVQFLTRPEIWRAQPGLTERLGSAPHTSERVGALAPEAPTVVPAHSSCVSPCAGPGWVAVGDAAAACDPLAAGGLAMAMRSGLRAGHALARWLLDGDSADLERYTHMQETAFADYLAQRARLYALERRWPRAPFWVGPFVLPR